MFCFQQFLEKLDLKKILGYMSGIIFKNFRISTFIKNLTPKTHPLPIAMPKTFFTLKIMTHDTIFFCPPWLIYGYFLNVTPVKVKGNNKKVC